MIGVVLAISMYTGLMTPPPPVAEIGEAISVVIMEDDPRWDCRTMGNEMCGQSGRIVRYVNGIEAMQ